MVAILDDDIMDALDLLQRQLADRQLLRREFEEDITQNNPEAGCWFTCSGGCGGSCEGTCKGNCKGGCGGNCSDACSGCGSTCDGYCAGACLPL